MLVSATACTTLRAVNLSRLPRRDDDLATFLASPVPRMVPARLRSAAHRQFGSALGKWFGLFFGVFGLVFVGAFFPWGCWNDWRLSAAEASVTDGRIISAAETNMSINEVKVWRYLFEYPVPDAAKPLRAECFTTGLRWQPGTPVRVRYLAGAGLACPEGARITESGFWSVWVIFFPVFGFGLAGYSIRRGRRVERILVHGRLEQARIIAVEKTSVRINHQRVFKVSLRLPGAGALAVLTLRSHVPAVMTFAESKLAAGESVTVLYDPEIPGQVVLPEAL